MTTIIQPLIVTPRPYVGESINGFILRTSELNGYETPTIMMHQVGMTSGEMNANIPRFEKMIPLYGRAASAFDAMGYKRMWVDRFCKRAPILQFDLPSIYIKGKSTHICVECVAENGYIDAFFDLKHAIACPIHCKKPIQSCQECGSRLKRHRQGLLKCHCGFDLSASQGEVVEDLPTLGLLSLLHSKLLGKPMEMTLLKDRLGFPVDHLEAMSLKTLIAIIGRMEGRDVDTHHCSKPQHKNVTAALAVARAAKALAHWPDGFYEFLKRLDSEDGSKKGFGLRKQFESFFGSFFKSGLPANEVEFFKEEFVRFGSEHWKQGYVSKKLARGLGKGENIVGVYGMAEALGVMPSTVRSMVKKGLISGNTVSAHGSTRHIFDLAPGLPFRMDAGASLTGRKAAALIGLPVSVLKVLRDKGLYEVQHIANPIAAYHENDVVVFRNKLLGNSPTTLLVPTEAHISLKQIMLMKTGSDEVKAAMIQEIISGQLIPVGEFGDGVEAMVFLRADVHRILQECKQEHLGLMTIVTAAKLLHCDPLVVKGLYRDGLLAGDKKPSGTYINLSSLERFGAQYVSCASIASDRLTNSNKLLRLCEKANIHLHWFPRVIGDNPQPFFARQDLELLSTWIN
jgi:hypothetical protein